MDPTMRVGGCGLEQREQGDGGGAEDELAVDERGFVVEEIGAAEGPEPAELAGEENDDQRDPCGKTDRAGGAGAAGYRRRRWRRRRVGDFIHVTFPFLLSQWCARVCVHIIAGSVGVLRRRG
jgi:hypothetical protein